MCSNSFDLLQAWYFCTGGVPDARLMTAGKFLHAFVGCISDVYIQALGPIDFSERAITGVNIQPCYL